MFVSNLHIGRIDINLVLSTMAPEVVYRFRSLENGTVHPQVNDDGKISIRIDPHWEESSTNFEVHKQYLLARVEYGAFIHCEFCRTSEISVFNWVSGDIVWVSRCIYMFSVY